MFVDSSMTEKEKRKAIQNRLDVNMMVESGAGGGKTTLIVSRVCNQIKSGKLKADQLVLITFTKAAAEELRSRLLAELHKATAEIRNSESITSNSDAEDSDASKDISPNHSANTDSTAAKLRNLEEAIASQDLIQISTIHSFCFRLLKERAFDSRLPLDAELLEDDKAQTLLDNFFDKWYGSLDSKEFKRLSDEFYPGKAAVAIKNVFHQIAELPDDTDIQYAKGALAPDSPKLQDYVDGFRNYIEAYFDAIVLEAQMVYRNAGDSVRITSMDDILKHPLSSKKTFLKKDPAVAYTEYKKASTPYEIIQVFNKVYGKTPFNKTGIKGIFPKEDVKAANQDILALTCAYTKEQLQEYESAVIIQAAVEAREAFRMHMQTPEMRHYVTNDSLLQDALRLVRENPEAKKYFQDKFKCIYVDEFQDTDPVQRDLIVELNTVDHEDGSKSLRLGGMFFVGDPKQSIYSFRGADLSIYNDTKEMYAPNSVKDVEIYILNNNYRSEKPIIDWVNRNYAERFPEISQDYSPMAGVNDNPDGDKILRGVFTMDNPSSFDKVIYGSLKDALRLQAGQICGLIRELTKGTYKIQERRTDGTIAPRPIRYSDFLVLCRKKEDAGQIAEFLKVNSIPVNLYGAVEMEKEPVLTRFLVLYHYLAYPYDPDALYGAEQVLVRGRLSDANISAAYGRAQELLKRTKKMTAYSAAVYLAHHLEYLLDNEMESVDLIRFRSRLQQLLDAVSEQAPQSRQQFEKNLIDFVRASSRDKELDLDMDSNSVRVMNLHKAKGLQGKIVIIAARKSPAKGGGSFHDRKNFYPSVVYSDKKNVAPLLTYANDQNAIVLESRQTAAENLRLEYVETTRAEEALIFMDCARPDAVFKDYDFSGTENILDRDELREAVCDGMTALDAVDDGESFSEMGDFSEAEGSADNDSFSYDSSIWDIAFSDDQKEKVREAINPSLLEKGDPGWNPGPDALPRPAGKTFGDIMHRSFELAVNLVRNGQNPDVKAIVAQAIAENATKMKDLPDNNPDSVVSISHFMQEKLHEFLENDTLMSLIKNAEEVYTEFGFSIPEGDHLISGQADLVLVNGDEIQIIDYKSDRKGNATDADFQAHLHHVYDEQQEVYKKVMSRIFHIAEEQVGNEYYPLY